MFEYLNPNKESHLEFLDFIEQDLINKLSDIYVVPFGDNTQHIFYKDKYYLTINWKLV